MNTPPICSLFSLSTTGCQPYLGMAFDGCRFYLTQPQHCRIQTFNTYFQRQETILTCRPYTCLCYDRAEHCFWASGEQPDSIFKLNCHFVEVACLHIKNSASKCSPIVGLSYNCDNNTLLIAFTDSLLKITKDGCCICASETPRQACNRSVLSIPPYYITVYVQKQQQYIGIYTCDGCMIKNYRFPQNQIIEAIVLTPGNQKMDNDCYFYLLVTKRYRHSEVLVCPFDSCGLGSRLCKCSNFSPHCGNSLCPDHPLPPKLPCPPSCPPPCPPSCPPPSPPSCPPPCPPSCPPPCPPSCLPSCPPSCPPPCPPSCPPPCPPSCPPPCTADVITSVALTETALAHILNAEGEKIQKALASTDNIDDLLAINHSINQTLINVTHLEHVLFAKLDSTLHNFHARKQASE